MTGERGGRKVGPKKIYHLRFGESWKGTADASLSLKATKQGRPNIRFRGVFFFGFVVLGRGFQTIFFLVRVSFPPDLQRIDIPSWH